MGFLKTKNGPTISSHKYIQCQPLIFSLKMSITCFSGFKLIALWGMSFTALWNAFGINVVAV
jgi:hypothetical protein